MCDSDQLAFVWRSGRILKSVLFLGAVPKIRRWVRSRWQLRFHYGLCTQWRYYCRRGQLFTTDAGEVGPKALHGDDDAAFLFEPLADACQALPIGNGSSDLGPESANLAGFRCRFSPAPLCEAEASFSDPLLLGLCVFFTLRHLLDSLRRYSTIIHIIRQFIETSTKFNAFRQLTAALTVRGSLLRPKTLVVEHKGIVRREVGFGDLLRGC
jgi:hypothetical protein